MPVSGFTMQFGRERNIAKQRVTLRQAPDSQLGLQMVLTPGGYYLGKYIHPEELGIFGPDGLMVGLR